VTIPFYQLAKELRKKLEEYPARLGPGYQDEIISEALRSIAAQVILERGVRVPCEKCTGLGSYHYCNTATWDDRPGILSGQAFTYDVCDECWGTGDKNWKGANLRTIRSALRAASPDDLRARGWTVAVHNDYRNHGNPYTFWLLTKGNRCVKGEGVTDAEALNEIRDFLQKNPFPEF